MAAEELSRVHLELPVVFPRCGYGLQVVGGKVADLPAMV